MKRICLILIAVLFSSFCVAEDIVDGENGTLNVYGTLVENTCHLSLDSAWQDIDMGVITRSDVKNIGSIGPETTLKIHLDDCPEITSWSSNITPMTHTVSTMQPAYQASFYSVADEKNPALIKVYGVTGVGLLLRDNQGKAINISRESNSILIPQGQSELIYTIQPVRDSGKFVAGSFHSLLNFSINYR